MAESDLLERLRTELPRLLREHPEVRHELWGLMLEAFPSRQEFLELLQEVRASREAASRQFEELRADMDRRFQELRLDLDRRFEAVDKRFEAVDKRFEAVDKRFEAVDKRFEAVDKRFQGVLAEMREQRLHLAALGGRVGRGLEDIVKGVVEEFAGQSFPTAERLTLLDEQGEVFGVPGAEIEFDLYAHDGAAYLVEVKSHLKPDDVLKFHRKAEFAQKRLGRPVVKLVLALSMEPGAETVLERLGIRHRVRATLD
jgi:hypothetical protein